MHSPTTTAAGTSAAAASSGIDRVYRIEVRARPDQPDPLSEAATRQARSLAAFPDLQEIAVSRVYLMQGSLSEAELQRICDELLADPVIEQSHIGAAAPTGEALIEVHPLPGVMDPDAEPIELAVQALLGKSVRVRSGRRYDFHGTSAEQARRIARQCFANPVIHAIHDQPHHPQQFLQGQPHDPTVVEVPIRDADDTTLLELSRTGHLFLNLEEMQAIQQHYRQLGREPREIELETLAQTWSEHCVHKTLKATIQYREIIDDAAAGVKLRFDHRPGHEMHSDGSVTIHNLLKSTVAAATHELIEEGIDWCLSVFVDNAGIIRFDDQHAVCFKVETHNHPSAIEPYGGAATGIGGVIRDIIGTGLAARPIAATDVFCVAHPDHFSSDGNRAEDSPRRSRSATEQGKGKEKASRHQGIKASSEAIRSADPRPHSPWPSVALRGELVGSLPAGCLHPRRILQQVVAGVRDYGNRMGIPTLNGAVWFHDDYIGNPLVYCGCVGVMPAALISGDPQPGDHIIALGGRTGRDGIHGATFSSAELTDTHAEEFSHAVQIGNPITEKKMLDAIIAARDVEDGCLFNAITDCGAGGFSSAVGEMAEALGAEVHLERAPLKYAGLTPTEIWISEAQERMVLAVPDVHIEQLREICEQHDVEMADLGTFGATDESGDAALHLYYRGVDVGSLAMSFLHEGLPQTTRQATWSPPPQGSTAEDSPRRSRSATEKVKEKGSRDQGIKASSEAIRSANPRSLGASVPRPLSLSPSGALRGEMGAALEQLLGHPNIASKHWIIRQYDHEVQGNSVIKPLVGPGVGGPSDAAVILPVEGSTRGLGIACGLATGLQADPYLMTLAAIDECVRNLVCTGVDPQQVAILDNFCWPGCDDPQQLGGLVRAAEACYDGAKAYRTPFISGKDSLNNQFTTDDGRTIRIPPTLLISGFGIVPNVNRCVTMDAKQPGNVLVLVGGTQPRLRGSHFEMCFGVEDVDEPLPRVDLDFGPRVARCVHGLIASGNVESAHDISDGGLVVAAAEMCIAGNLGFDFAGLAEHLSVVDIDVAKACFGEGPSTYLLEVSPETAEALLPQAIKDAGLPEESMAVLGRFNDSGRLTLHGHIDVAVDTLREAWRKPLDW